jgi:hypothetical protein
MDVEGAQAFIAESQWTFAKTMPQSPHWYTVRPKQNDEVFADVVRLIRDEGYIKNFKGRKYTCLDIGEYRYWAMGPAETTRVINRAVNE